MTSNEITIRVRYAETDRMGFLHNSAYLVYFEMGRIELLRSRGLSYRDLEDQGYLMVLSRLEIKYKSPGRYDDVLRLVTRVDRSSMVRVDHGYELLREDTLLAEGNSTLVCVDRAGNVQKLHPALLAESDR